jgi:hypothetical protein
MSAVIQFPKIADLEAQAWKQCCTMLAIHQYKSLTAFYQSDVLKEALVESRDFLRGFHHIAVKDNCAPMLAACMKAVEELASQGIGVILPGLHYVLKDKLN